MSSNENIEPYDVDEEFTNWQRCESGAEMIKMQHPDCGLFSAGSTHYSTGVSWADCHMAYTGWSGIVFQPRCAKPAGGP